MERFSGPDYSLSLLKVNGSELTVATALNRRARRKGLLGLDELDEGFALSIREPLVHMLGMRFPIDLVWLGAGNRIVRIDRNVAPGPRLKGCLRSVRCLEMAAGQADALSLKEHQTL